MYCSSTQLIACVGEIEAAWEKCSSAGSVDDVLNCIQVYVIFSNEATLISPSVSLYATYHKGAL